MYKHILDSVYSDTDSLFTNKPLNENIIGKGIGKFKPEYGGELISYGLFPSPKLYLLELENGKIVSKRKGFSGHLSILDYLELYRGFGIDVIDER